MSKVGSLTDSSFLKLINVVNSASLHQVNLPHSNLSSQQVSMAHASEAVNLPVHVENRVPTQLTALYSQVEVTETSLASLTSAQLVNLMQEMFCSNNKLLSRVVQLETALAENQNELQSHKEFMLTQKEQELSAIEKQVESLFHQLKASQQTVQRQQILIETLTQQLAISQERVAQMERDCSLTQSAYNEAESKCRELRTRLNRQQRHSMQLKVALEKCLEVSGSSDRSEVDNYGDFTTVVGASNCLFFPKAEPIQPWSTSPSFSGELETLWTVPSGEPQFISQETGAFFNQAHCNPTQFWHLQSEIDKQTQLEQNNTFNQGFSSVSSSSFPDAVLQEQQDVVREILFEASSVYSSTTLQSSEEAAWQDLFALLEPEAAVTNESVENLRTKLSSNQTNQPLNQPNSTAADHFNNNSSEQVDLAQPETDSPRANYSFLPPVVYPSRPPKGRKSLSAIELPNFNQKKVD